MICQISTYAYLKPFALGLFLGAFFMFIRLRKPRCYKIEAFTKARFQ